jgi:hypothetical protein
MAEKAVQNFYDIVKVCRGGLSLDLPAYDSSVQNRLVRFEPKTERMRVARVFALGIFVDPVLEQMYKEGYFRVEPEKVFETDVENVFYPIEDKIPTHSDEELMTYLTKGNRQKIREIMEESPVAREAIITLASENIDSLSQSMIKDLEKMLQVELIVDEE